MAEWSQDARKAYEAAMLEASRLSHEMFSTEHLLLGLVSLSECQLTAAFTKRGVTLEKVREAVEAKHPPVADVLVL